MAEMTLTDFGWMPLPAETMTREELNAIAQRRYLRGEDVMTGKRLSRKERLGNG